MTSRGSENELDWLAFAYVAGELSADESEEFEQRLANDQLAREAVARAVELTQVVAAAEEHCVELASASRPLSGRQHLASWSTRLSWMALGGLAALVLAMVWSGMRITDDETPTAATGAATSRQQARALARAWSQTRADLAEGDGELWFPAHLATADVGETGEDVASDEESLADAPSWMTAGVFGLAGISPEDVLQPDDAPEPFSSERGDN